MGSSSTPKLTLRKVIMMQSFMIYNFISMASLLMLQSTILQVVSSLEYIAPADNGSFCSRYLALSSCPTPPTIDNIDLARFLGSYYEIGSTAGFKSKNEPGLVCSTANFSVAKLPSPGDQHSGVTINVLNSGLQVVGSQTISALSKIASASYDVCANTRRMCGILSPGSKVSDALSKISAVIQQIAEALPTEADRLRQASGSLNSSLAQVQARLDNLARAVNTISQTSAQLNQAVGHVDPLLQQLRSTVGQGEGEARIVGGMVIGNLSTIRTLLIDAAAHLSDGYAEQLTEAAALLEQEMDQITAQISKIEANLSIVGGPLADMIAADRNATNVTAMLRVTKAQAIQSPDQRGNMDLKMQQSSLPYKIIALEGLPMMGYTAALIYSCQSDSNGDPISDLFLLARTPSLPTATVDRLLGVARSHGIYTDCDSPFVLSSQRGGHCGAPLL